MSARRETVRQALSESSGFRSAQDLYTDLRAEGSKIGLTTVYRALQSLNDSGEIDVLLTDEGEAVYRACDTETHHHHLVCRMCSTAIEIESPTVEKWAVDIGAAHGFTNVTHTVEVYGTCANCSLRAARQA